MLWNIIFLAAHVGSLNLSKSSSPLCAEGKSCTDNYMQCVHDSRSWSWCLYGSYYHMFSVCLGNHYSEVVPET